MCAAAGLWTAGCINAAGSREMQRCWGIRTIATGDMGLGVELLPLLLTQLQAVVEVQAFLWQRLYMHVMHTSSLTRAECRVRTGRRRRPRRRCGRRCGLGHDSTHVSLTVGGDVSTTPRQVEAVLCGLALAPAALTGGGVASGDRGGVGGGAVTFKPATGCSGKWAGRGQEWEGTALLPVTGNGCWR